MASCGGLKGLRISVVVPVHNEEGNLGPLLEALRPVLDGLGASWEVLLVDDGSTDGGPAEMLALLAKDPRVRVLRLDPRRGQSAAFWCGFREARGEVVVTLDADLQNDPRDIPRLLQALEEADAAVGWRRERRDPLSKRLASRLANALRNRITSEANHDVGCSLKAFRRSALEGLFPFEGMHRFFPTLIRLAGLRVVEVPVRHHPRRRGRSKYGLLDRLLAPLLDCLAVRWMQRRSLGKVEAREVVWPPAQGPSGAGPRRREVEAQPSELQGE